MKFKKMNNIAIKFAKIKTLSTAAQTISRPRAFKMLIMELMRLKDLIRGISRAPLGKGEGTLD